MLLTRYRVPDAKTKSGWAPPHLEYLISSIQTLLLPRTVTILCCLWYIRRLQLNANKERGSQVGLRRQAIKLHFWACAKALFCRFLLSLTSRERRSDQPRESAHSTIKHRSLGRKVRFQCSFVLRKSIHSSKMPCLSLIFNWDSSSTRYLITPQSTILSIAEF